MAQFLELDIIKKWSDIHPAESILPNLSLTVFLEVVFEIRYIVIQPDVWDFGNLIFKREMKSVEMY